MIPNQVVTVRAFRPADIPVMRGIWNSVVRAADAFPQEEPIADDAEAGAFFGGQSFAGVAELDGAIAGLYILHPNAVGRCGHIANASYAVDEARRGQGIGEALVRDSLAKGKELGFRILQFNAVVASNAPALHLYAKLGFLRLGLLPGGYHLGNGRYEDLVLMYHTLL